MSNQNYYLLASLAEAGCSMTEESEKQAWTTWRCRKSQHTRPGFEGVDVVLKSAPERSSLNFEVRLGIASMEFLSALGMDVVERHFYLGRVLLRNGTQLDNWATFHGRQKIIVRGTNDVGYHLCSECNQPCYYASPPSYLYPRPPADAEIFDAGFGSIVVVERILDRIRSTVWKKLLIEELLVLDSPKDGLGELV